MKKSLSLLAGAAMSLVVATGYADTVNEGERKIISSGQVSGSDLRLMLQEQTARKTQVNLLIRRKTCSKNPVLITIPNYKRVRNPIS